MAQVHLVGPYDFRDAENTNGITEFDNKNLINCKMQNIVQFAKMWMQFIKICVFPAIISVFLTVTKPNEQKRTMLLCFGVIYGHTATPPSKTTSYSLIFIKTDVLRAGQITLVSMYSRL